MQEYPYKDLECEDAFEFCAIGVFYKNQLFTAKTNIIIQKTGGGLLPVDACAHKSLKQEIHL